MEKMIYTLWKKDEQSISDFRQQLLTDVGQQLLASGVHRLRLSLADELVEPASSLCQQNIQPLLDGMISMWVDTAITRSRQEQIIAAVVDHFHGYLVTESEPIVNTRYPAVAGERTYGMCQVVLLQRPGRISYKDWLDVWQNSHTQVAIDTQSTFCYRQNVVTRKLTVDGPVIDAIVEENFPPQAMNSPHAFFDAIGDDKKLQSNISAMSESCSRFIDFDKLDVTPTSEYLIKG